GTLRNNATLTIGADSNFEGDFTSTGDLELSASLHLHSASLSGTINLASGAVLELDSAQAPAQVHLSDLVVSSADNEGGVVVLRASVDVANSVSIDNLTFRG